MVEQLEGTNIVSCKWVFKIKKNAAGEIDKYKMQLVASPNSMVSIITKLMLQLLISHLYVCSW